MYKQYAAGVEKVANQISRGLAIDSDDLPVLNRKAINRSIGEQSGGCALEKGALAGFRADHGDAVRREINEAYLLHGLPKEHLDKVLFEDSGLDPIYSRGSGRDLFGEGVYMAEDVEKADQYTDGYSGPDKQHGAAGLEALHRHLYPSAADHPGPEGGGVCYMLVCRAVRGYAIRTRGRSHANREQCVAIDDGTSETGFCFHDETRKELIHMPKRTNLDGSSAIRFPYHSLVAELGDTIGRFREFVVFHREYVYPEYVVAYRRVRRSSSGPPDGLEPEPE